MVDIAKIPLKKRLQDIDQHLYTAGQQASPGEVILSAEVYNEVVDILQELIDDRDRLSEDLESAYESIGEEIEGSAALLDQLGTMTKTADGLANKVVDLRKELAELAEELVQGKANGDDAAAV